MDATLTQLLRCPVCAAGITADDGGSAAGLICRSGHRFDRARQGYFNLLTGRASSFVPDTAEMVAARADFLSAGHYDRLATAIADETVAASRGKQRPAILDAGAGTGFHLDRVLQDLPTARAVAMDISKFALRRAARAVPGALCLVWDVWRPLPVPTGAVDVIVNVFAPRHVEEFARVLSGSGRLLVVTPRPGHLAEIRSVASLLDVPPEKTAKLNRALEGHFAPESHRDIEFSLELSPADIRLAALMGPSAHHLDRAVLDGQLRGHPERTTVTAAFRLSVYAPA
ncbi:methyltransferase domain-containing protein [Arthrobacter castelli]|uniref:methyltransferase domain-containing protein n=1 Tax=Arthrobacter castelli TaxID=271431 RepID=UPI0004061C2D|nr:methyltransferase domain-containing protein [Arthrobacter castelli]